MKKYLNYIKKEVYISAIIFFLAFIFGYFYADIFPLESELYFSEIKEYLSIEHETNFQIFLGIFENNVNAMLNIVFLGMFLGLFSMTFLLVNGFTVGLVANIFVKSTSWIMFFSGVLPHGIIEIPCVFFSAAIGFKVGSAVLKKILKKRVDVTDELAKGLEFSILVMVPLLFLAAFIEAYTTPCFMALADFLF